MDQPRARRFPRQSCLDRDVSLATGDADFDAFARVAGLRLLVERA